MIMLTRPFGLLTFCILALGISASSLTHAALTIEITQRLSEATPIAVVPFGGVKSADNTGSIIAADLDRSGSFNVIENSKLPSQPTSSAEILPSVWQNVPADFIVVGSVSRLPDGRLSYRYELLKRGGLDRVLGETFIVDSGRDRDAAHYIADKIYKQATGEPGIFATKILYVNQYIRDGKKRYRLELSDIDGARQITLLDSAEPILSPTWSPSARQIAYVSFESRKPAIFVQNLVTRQRTKLTDFSGLNGAPSWSPDGKRMAMTLSRDGNPELYVMDLTNNALTRLTNHPAIDTEPRWTSDGKSLIFTSDRSGGPQIYRINIASGDTKRLTFTGKFNARADISPNDRHLAMVHQSGGNNYAIALQDLSNGVFSTLTDTPLDESPSFSPNSKMVVYATRKGNKGVLGIMSLDGRFKLRLPAVDGEVREPVWSPYLR
jgi:TolB protein